MDKRLIQIHDMQAGLRAELIDRARAIQRCIMSVAEHWGGALCALNTTKGPPSRAHR